MNCLIQISRYKFSLILAGLTKALQRTSEAVGFNDIFPFIFWFYSLLIDDDLLLHIFSGSTVPFVRLILKDVTMKR